MIRAVVAGVCDGNDASGSLSVTMGTLLASPVSSSDLTDPLSDARIAISDAIVGLLSSGLARNPNTVSVSNLTLVSQRRLSVGPRLLSATGTSVVAASVLLPFGGANAQSPGQLSAQLLTSGAPPSSSSSSSSSVLSIQAVTGAAPTTVCGNGVCESGERPDASSPGCAADCPYPVLTCPVVNGAVCNAAGSCVAPSSPAAASSVYSGRCECRPSQGYSGDSCSECAPGFSAAAGGSACVKLEAAPRSTSVSSSSSSTVFTFPVIVIIAGGGGLLALVLLGVLVRVAVVRKRQRRVRVFEVGDADETGKAREGSRGSRVRPSETDVLPTFAVPQTPPQPQQQQLGHAAATDLSPSDDTVVSVLPDRAPGVVSIARLK